jgi:two-component system chemotaxis response regulator CheB
MVIVQHMPGPFLVSFSERLNKLLPQDVRLLERGAPLSNGQIRLAPECGAHSVVCHTTLGWQHNRAAQERGDLHCPSADRLFNSALPQAPFVTAVVLTGLGRDGAMGLKALRNAGAHTIGQDRGSSVVYGMPRAAFELGAVAEQLPLSEIAGAINHVTATRHKNRGM